MKPDPWKTAADLGLTVESDRSSLQTPLDGRRALLAAVYPWDKRIVLFDRNIEAFCREKKKDRAAETARLVLHEVAHYRDWLKARQARKAWNPRCWKAELRIRRLNSHSNGN